MHMTFDCNAPSPMRQKPPRLALVMPCYNEEEILESTISHVTNFYTECMNEKLISTDSYLLLVDDGSKDKTWEIIYNQSQTSSLNIIGLKLSRNKGHQTALLAGLEAANNYDVIVSMDADLQDDIQTIKEMVSCWKNGFDVVYGVRGDRTSDTFFKRETAHFFYRLMLFMGVNLISNHADFRMMDKRALDALLEYPERNLFLRGLVPLIGFQSTTVKYARLERTAGETKYPISRMLSLAVEGITSFSVTPLRFISLSGLIISLFSFLMIPYALFGKIHGHTVPGWASVTIAIFFMGGVQMLSLGIIGEYIGKIYLETKRRPRYHIEKYTTLDRFL